MPNKRSLFQVITIGCQFTWRGHYKKKQSLCVERFHRGRFLFGKWFEETAFSSEDAFEWTVSTVERQLTYPEDSPQDNNTYVVDSSAEDDIDTEVS